MSVNISVWRLAAQTLISTLILNTLASNDKHVVAELSVIPLWNVTVNQTDVESCGLTTDNSVADVAKFSGDAIKTCSVQLALSNGTAALIRIPQGALLYAERQDNILNCEMKYVYFTADETCIVVTWHPKLQLFLQGDGVNGSNIDVIQMPVNTSAPICPDGTGTSKEQHKPRVSQTNHCQAHEFDDLFSCDLSFDYTCSFKFPGNCNVILGNRIAELQCLDDTVHSSHKALTIYPPGIITLDLEWQNIVKLNINPFIQLKSLKTLLLSHNNLAILPRGIVSGLRSLEYLTLRGNRLISLDGDMFNETKKLTYLILWKNNLNHLPNHLFRGLDNLNQLDFDENYLTGLPRGTFKGLENLEYLYLSRNKINLLEEGLFEENHKLSFLYLNDNELTVIPNGLFMGLGDLKILNLQGNQINSLYEELFTKTSNLTKVYLDFNDLTVLPKGLFMGMGNLEYLFLRRNQINSIDEILFHETNKLIQLDLYDNNLAVLPKGTFKGLTNLESLDLSKNRIKSLGEELFDETNKLFKLDLTDNDLTVLPKGLFMGMGNLEYLFLGRNQIISIDEILFHETNKLIQLDLSDNNLTNLPNGLFIGLRNVKYLTIKGNRLSSLDVNIFNETKKLTYLILWNNNLKQLPKGLFYGLDYLTVLDIGDNDFMVLPKGTFKMLTNLEYLDLSRNRIKSLDEKLFDEINKLIKLDLTDNDLTVLPKGLFIGLANLEILSLSMNRINKLDEVLFHETKKLIELDLKVNKLTSLPKGLSRELKHLEFLRVNMNRINSLHENLFNETKELIFLDLQYNNLVKLSNNLFKGLRNLDILALGGNKIVDLNKEMFRDLQNIRYLYLLNNRIKALNFDVFQNLRKIAFLDISDNKLKNIPDISKLRRLSYLNVKGNELTGITKETFSYLSNQTELIAGQHELCECYVSKDIKCTAVEDRSPFLTCDRLLSDRVLVVVMWLIGLNALGGNMFVLSQKKKIVDKNKVQNFLLQNLAMSDLLMGVYMLLIASSDIYFGEYFPMQAEAWRSGITCRVAGTISIVSSEASVFFVTLISVDRFVSIKYHNSRRKLGQKSSAMTAIVIWIMTFILGIVPSSLAGKNKKFYDNSHVCIGLPLSKLQIYETTESEELNLVCPVDDICYWKKPVQSEYIGEVNGMIFASVMFLGLNFLCYLVILACYVEIIRTVYKSSKRAGLNPGMKEQIRMTAKVAAIVLTDFACWFPITIIGFLVQAGVLTVPPDVFAWCVTFVLPINSAINPYLYTIAAIINSRLKRAQIAPIENQHENTNRAYSGRRLMHESRNTQEIALRSISHDARPHGPESNV